MESLNETSIEGFVLLGITEIYGLKIFLFILFLTFYMFTLLGNLSIVSLIILDQMLHKPMYFFLGNLSFLDIFYSTTTVPKMLSGLLIGDKKVSFYGCVLQLHFYHFLGSSEALLLTAMSYDRYVAICNPLRYPVVMAKTICVQLASGCWSVGFLYSLSQTIIVFRLPFCDKQITHFYCDIKPVLKLSCTNTRQSEIMTSTIFAFVAVSTFSLIVMSYILIGTHLLNIQSTNERWKAFSTCTSHITVVFLYIGTALCTYLGPMTQNSLEQDRISAILVTVFTPALNPLIYTLRNKEVKRSLKKILGGHQNTSDLY